VGCCANPAGGLGGFLVAPTGGYDRGMADLSERIARRLEEELQYPGQIKVVVIRETRAVDFAR
jgi:ribonucrease Y